MRQFFRAFLGQPLQSLAQPLVPPSVYANALERAPTVHFASENFKNFVLESLFMGFFVVVVGGALGMLPVLTVEAGGQISRIDDRSVMAYWMPLAVGGALITLFLNGTVAGYNAFQHARQRRRREPLLRREASGTDRDDEALQNSLNRQHIEGSLSRRPFPFLAFRESVTQACAGRSAAFVVPLLAWAFLFIVSALTGFEVLKTPGIRDWPEVAALDLERIPLSARWYSSVVGGITLLLVGAIVSWMYACCCDEESMEQQRVRLHP